MLQFDKDLSIQVFNLYHDLSDSLSSNIKLLADGTSLFLVTHASDLNSDLKKIHDWIFHWKIIFIPDCSKQAQEISVSRKLRKKTLFFFSITAFSLKLILKCI